jgi:hypothetical protein
LHVWWHRTRDIPLIFCSLRQLHSTGERSTRSSLWSPISLRIVLSWSPTMNHCSLSYTSTALHHHKSLFASDVGHYFYRRMSIRSPSREYKNTRIQTLWVSSLCRRHSLNRIFHPNLSLWWITWMNSLLLLDMSVSGPGETPSCQKICSVSNRNGRLLVTNLSQLTVLRKVSYQCFKVVLCGVWE